LKGLGKEKLQEKTKSNDSKHYQVGLTLDFCTVDGDMHDIRKSVKNEQNTFTIVVFFYCYC